MATNLKSKRSSQKNKIDLKTATRRKTRRKRVFIRLNRLEYGFDHGVSDVLKGAVLRHLNVTVIFFLKTRTRPL